MKRLLLAAVGLLLGAGLLFAADVSAPFRVVVTPHGLLPPPQAATDAGYTTLAFNGDMTQSFDITCENPATADHQWYLGANRTMAASCQALTWPHVDETTGENVLLINYGPATANQGFFHRQGIATADTWGAHQTSFPNNAYYECTIRFSEHSISHMALWSACWFVNANTDVISGVNPGLGLEFDLNEFHGGYPNNQELAGAINWNCRDTCYSMAFFGNFADKVPGWDPTQFHTYGWLLTKTTSTNLHGKAYIDNVLVNEGDIQLDPGSLGPGTDERIQRNYILIHLNAGCNFDEGGNYCFNTPIGSIGPDSDGNTQVTLVAPNVWCNCFYMGISGVQGVTSPINGNWLVDCGGLCSSFHIIDPVTNQFVPFSGTYTAGSGILNEWNDTDKALKTYVKSYRVWSCATWATTNC